MAPTARRAQGDIPAPPVPSAQHRRRSAVPLASDYVLEVAQQPRQGRMAGSGDKADRRAIDPPPVVRLRIRKPSARHLPRAQLKDSDLRTPTLTHTLFMFASLVPENSEEEMYEVAGSRSKLVAGSVVSSLFHLKDQSCFVFPDLSVRVEGRWRFKMSLFELKEDGVSFCTSIFTDVFTVYSSKRFPGVGKSTELSKSFAQQGLKLRIRRPGSIVNPMDAREHGLPTLAHGQHRKSSSSRHPAVDNSADPPSRRPSAPVASTSSARPSLVAAGKRPCTSHDSAAGVSPSTPQLRSNAYAPYPSRLSVSTTVRGQEGPPQAYAGRRAVSGSQASLYRGEASSHSPRHPQPRPPASAYPPQPLHPATSFPAPNVLQSQISRGAHSLGIPHSRSYSALSPPAPSPSHHAYPSPSFPSYSHPQAHPYPRPPSPPPMLAPIRSLPSFTAGPSRPAASSSSTRAPAASSRAHEYDAATVAAGAALVSLCALGRRESAERSTPPPEPTSLPAGGPDVDMLDMGTGEKRQPLTGGGSLAMLLGEGASEVKEKGAAEVSFF